MSEPREVFIRLIYRNNVVVAYHVLYASRRKHQRYLAAQFDAGYGLENVKTWVEARPQLKLVRNNANEVQEGS